MFDRRELLKRSSLLAAVPTIPGFLANTARALQAEKDQRVLVVIQMDGGNDGVNTVVPFADEGYAKHRTRLRLPQSTLIKLNDQVGLHSSMAAFGELWEQEQLAIVQGVGYPNPNRSHDVSMAIWQTCRFDRGDHDGYGWLGRALDQRTRPADGSPGAMHVGDETLPVAVRGRTSRAGAVNRLDEFVLPRVAARQAKTATDDHDLTAFVTRTAVDAQTTARQLAELGEQADSTIRYPSTQLARRLQLISRLMKADFGTRVYYTVQAGYDTHAAQLPAHSRLLRELSEAVKAFTSDLHAAGLDQQVCILCFSEFGRRVNENASLGTDHGTSGPVFLIGRGVAPGLHAATPPLSDLEQGDLKMSIDFRRVYAGVLKDWLQMEPAAAVGGQFEAPRLFAG